ncbi:GntR family transcriptional regulator [Bradyrhizobium sp. HKCCYLS3077]|uniref:GntR family transcriptional regulator n=1 Tax=unclassified Bradyrhizobium TaxID=2631580 RepID=UPI003EB7AD10
MAAAVERAYAAIREGILGGKYPGGSHLKAEDLADAVGVSRTPVREALRRLHAEGLVDFVANRGAYVLSWERSDAEEVFSLRMVLESFGAEQAAVRRSPEQLARLRELAERMSVAARERGEHHLEVIAELNTEFHQLLHDASGVKRLGPLLKTIIQIPLTMRTFSRYDDEDLQRSAAHHCEIVAAIERRDSEWAGAVMRSHIAAARHVILGSDAQIVASASDAA